MKQQFRHIAGLAIAAAALTFVCLVANGAAITEREVRTASAAFLSSDAVGRTVLGGRSVSGVSQRSGLWIVRLAPSGYIIMSGSDLADPIVAFSARDYSEPGGDSPAGALLDGAGMSAGELEAAGKARGRHERWTRLLGSSNVRLRALRSAAADVPDEAVVIEPFLTARWSQSQPYNDYAPLYEADESSLLDSDINRGRCPCGCVVVAAAQMLRHFKWPARIDGVHSCTHDYIGANGATNLFSVRFDGRRPIDWDVLQDEYERYFDVATTNYFPDGGYEWRVERKFDLRGRVPEADRHPVSRLMLWAGVLAETSFSPSMSSASYSTVAENIKEWYTVGQWMDLEDCADLVREHVAAGIPCQVAVWQDRNGERDAGHHVVVHGWAEGSSARYAYLNFGWAGENDGYYNIAEDFGKYNVKRVYVGHCPRAKPQLDPLPAVCGTNVTVRWHFPEVYADRLSRFDVSLRPVTKERTSFFDDFSDSTGVSSAETGSINGGENDRIHVCEDPSSGDGRGMVLCVDAFAVGTYTFPASYILTASSVLTFKLRSVYACTYEACEIQASFDGGEWETVSAPALTENFDSGWREERVYLGGHGGSRARFRVNTRYNWEPAYGITKVLFDDFRVADVLAAGECRVLPVDKGGRALELSGLAEGTIYDISVTPVMSGAAVAAETSDVITACIAGECVVPAPGEETFHVEDFAFSSDDAGEAWSFDGTVEPDGSVSGPWKCSVVTEVQGVFTRDSCLHFSWSANEYYGEYEGAPSFDVLSVEFTDFTDGSETTLWTLTNETARTSLVAETVPLGDLSGRRGRIAVGYRHVNGGYGRGGRLSGIVVTNVSVPSAPDVSWRTCRKASLGMPRIFNVSVGGEEIAEGMYHECGFGETVFQVSCSGSVVSLAARPSHLSLLGDDRVAVEPLGGGRFNVRVSGAGMTHEHSRTRMLLTLAATDVNGTTVCKDISLRFSADAGQGQGQERPEGIVETLTDYEGAYDGAGHGISVEVSSPENAEVRYSMAAEGPYQEENILFTNASDEIRFVWYVVEAPGHASVTNCGMVTIRPVEITGDMVRMADAALVYDGTAKTPEVSVSVGSATLLAGTDYAVSYSESINAGSAQAVVTGMGNYVGEVVKSFVIVPRSMETATLDSVRFDHASGHCTPVAVLGDGLGRVIDPANYDFTWDRPDSNSGTVILRFTGYGNFEGTYETKIAHPPYHVAFDARGGTTGEPLRAVAKNAKVGSLPSAVRTGYTFNGWYTKISGGTKIKTSTVVKKDVTYYAQWTANKYTIKFDKNGGSGTMKSISATYDKSVALTANAFKRANCSFLGWSIKKNAAEATYANKQKVKNLTAGKGKTVTLYAVWKRNTYKVKFNANGGAGEAQAQTLECGSKVALSKNTFVREGFVFAGWAEKKTGAVKYKNKAKVKDLAKSGKSVTLYAVWKPEAWATGTFSGAGEIGGKVADVSLTVASAGKISGKFVLVKNKKSYSFKADGFDGFSDGALRATAPLKYGTKSCTLEIAVGKDEATGKGVPAIEVLLGGKRYGWGFYGE